MLSDPPGAAKCLRGAEIPVGVRSIVQPAVLGELAVDLKQERERVRRWLFEGEHADVVVIKA